MPTIQVDMLEGKSQEQKRAMVKNVTDAVVESIGCKPEKVKIIIREMKKEHLANGGILESDK